MTEEKIVKARAAAELEIEQLLRIFKHTLIETYMKGFLKGMESMEDEDAALKRLNEEAESLDDFCEAEDIDSEAAKAMLRSLKKARFDIKDGTQH